MSDVPARSKQDVSIQPRVLAETLEEIDESAEKEDLRKLEAVLFISGRWLSMAELVSLTDLNPIIIRELIEKLQEKYDKKDSSIEILEKKGALKMDLRREFSYLVNRLATGSAEFSKAEQETLAIIAYKQPIKQSVIIKIRGNKAYEHVKKFADLGLLKKKKVGHTYELTLGDSFYDYFNVKEREDGKGMDIDEESKEYQNDDLDKEIEEAEKEVAKEEAAGKFDDDEEKKALLSVPQYPQEGHEIAECLGKNPTGYGEGVEVVAEGRRE
ncbi:SMC-Scp complex subunit ScpB [archaeon]|jgi:segregation and condensation protein B|nr:SMC-Scp complex subunit ScpB [archaeon]MBT4373636.1 SMC-Scp complex subunit ScpB [archaeon]MBT4531690.1 SMC-Scp complex subunit ScpB [archaeon]MBT7001802.1 SMC-Scp complex subunit ScpB [archaeon]MBT7281787.1 SMC-Scp complex subunit ScpB [archaeon]